MATSGVGMLAQVLGSTLEANRRNAMWQAEQQQQNEMAEQSHQAARENLATQLKAHLMGQLIADATKNVAMAQSEDRWAQRERERDAAAAAALDKQDAREAARVKAMEREWALRGAEGDKARAAALELERQRGLNAARTAGVPRYSITDKRGGTTGGGQQPDVRKTQLFNEMNDAKSTYLGLKHDWALTIDGQNGAPPPKEVTDAAARYLSAQKAFHDAGGVDPVPVVGGGGQPPAAGFDPNNPFARRKTR